MNERIRELAKQALDYANGCEAEAWDGAYERKFAELIVRECLERIKVVISEEAMPVTSDYFLYDFKQHFGVEE